MSCAGRFCLCTCFIVVVERTVVCLKSFPLLLYSEPSCPSAMSDGKISVPGHYQMKGIQTSCGQLPSRGTMKDLFPGWEQRDSSSFLCQLVEHTKLLQFKVSVFSFVTNLLSIARKKFAREFIYWLCHSDWVTNLLSLLTYLFMGINKRVLQRNKTPLLISCIQILERKSTEPTARNWVILRYILFKM